MAPFTESLEVLKSVVEEVAVFVVDLAHAGFAAPFARPFRIEAFRGVRRAGAGLRPTIWVEPLCKALAASAAICAFKHTVSFTSSGLWVG